MQDRHGFNGFTLFTLSFIQVVGGLICPSKQHPYRTYWLWIHRLIAVLVLASFIRQIFTGFRRLHRMSNIHGHVCELFFECFAAFFFTLVASCEVTLYFKSVVHFLVGVQEDYSMVSTNTSILGLFLY
jgi:hypothetical protein